MSLFQFKVSSLCRQKGGRTTNGLLGNSFAPTTSSAFGAFPKKAERVEDEASQFFIDEKDLWNDDVDEDVFEQGNTNKQKKNKTIIKSPEKPCKLDKTDENPVNKTSNCIEESEDFSDYKIKCIEESVEGKGGIENDVFVIEEKKQSDIDHKFTDHSYREPPDNEFCFDLVDDSDDDIILPESPECKNACPKSPTFCLSNKYNKRNTNDWKKSDSCSDSYSDHLTSKPDVGNNIEEKSNLLRISEGPGSPEVEKNTEEKSNLLSISKEQISPLGLAEETDLWLNTMLQNEAFSNVSSDGSREKLQKNLTFLNKSYVEILEKVMSAFENLPLELLRQFPQFDPNVFMTLRTTRRRIKAIIIKTENMLKRKNSEVGFSENIKFKENKNVEFSELESPASRDQSRLEAINPFDETAGNKSSEGFFSFKQPPKSRDLQARENFLLLSPPGLDGKAGAVMDSPARRVAEENSFKSSTPLSNHENKLNSSLEQSGRANPLDSSLIDYTDVLYKTCVKSSEEQNAFGSGRFQAHLRNNGTSGEFDGMNYPHSKELLEKFRQKFGLRTFRPNQLQVINAALLGHDCFVLMPTGGGKSLCYQLPALVSKGVTVVVSPLRSLILDQVTKLLTLDIAAAHLSGDLKESEVGSVYIKLNQAEPRIKLLYVTPEKIGASTSLKKCLFGLYKRNMLARFVIDEAHCVSQWGHDFRPDYKKLRELRENFPNVNIMALTATATPRVRTDILHQLKVVNPKWFLSSFNRSNLVYSVREKKGKSALKEIAALIQNEFKKDTGVIYCFSRKECEDVAKSLKEYGIAAIPYHAGLNDNERTRAQNMWMNDKVKVVCATIAFGMGIDKLDVRFVIHFSLPKSIEGYYQESGRAGRDGEKATCILYYCYRDRIRMLKLINMDQTMTNLAAKKVHVDNLFRVAAFAENKTDCRRALQLEYFGEKFDRKNCIENRDTACDNCLNQGVYETIDVTAESKAIVSSIKDVCGRDDKRNSNFTMLHFVDVFKGTVLKKVISEGHDTLPLYGMGKSWQRLDVERLFRKLIMEDFIKERLMVKDDGITFAYVKLGHRGEELLKGNIRIMFDIKKRKGSNSAQATVKTEERVDPSVLEIQEKCYSELMEAIHEIASSVNCNPNAIMNVQALRAMSNSLPETAEEMLSINHVTTANFEKYGNILLEITKKYSEQKKMLKIEEVPEDLFMDDPWSRKNSDDSPYFETEISYIGKGKGKGGKKRKKSSSNRKPQNSKKWKGGYNSSKATSSKSTGGRGRGKAKDGGNGSGVTTVVGAKLSALMELPTNKSRGFDRPKVILKNL